MQQSPLATVNYTASPGITFSVGTTTVENSLTASLSQAKINRERYATNANLVAFYDSEIRRIEEELLAKGLAIVVVYFRNRGSIAVEDINMMKG